MRLVLLLTSLTNPVAAQIGEIDVNAGPPAERASNAPADRSALWIESKTRALLMVVDRQGRRTGVDPKSKKVFEEIPNSTCEVDFVNNKYTGEEAVEAYERIAIQPAPTITYQFRVAGLQDGPFQVDISALSRDGSSEPSKQLEGLISEGEKKSFLLSFDSAPKSKISIVEGH